MRYFDSEFIDRVRQASDILLIIEKDTQLRARGDQSLGVCPFPEHDEKTPSFSVSSSKQVYYCFGCQRSGDIFTYLQEQRGWNFVEAVEFLASQARIPLPSLSAKQSRKTSQLSHAFKLNEKAAKFYYDCLLKQDRNAPVWKYLNERAYTKDSIEDFRLGYAPKGSTFLRHLKPEELPLAKELGLIGQKNEGNKYDNYRDRLMFPIISARHQVQGFGGRVLDNSLPKYINSKESEVFQKGNSFYGLNLSAKFLKQENLALVVEGYTDYISLFQRGIKNLVATLGTALTSGHARLLKKYVGTVVLIFDGDDAGMRAAERSLPLLLAEGLEVKSITLPDKQDPDNFIQQAGVEALEALIFDSKDLFFQILKKKLIEIKTKGRNKMLLIDEMQTYLDATKNPSLLSLYKQRILDVFGNDARIASRKLNQTQKREDKKQTTSPEQASQSTKPCLSKALPAEQLLLALCLDKEKYLKKFLSLQASDLIKTPFVFDIFQKLESKYGQKPENFDRLLSLMTEEVANSQYLFKDSHLALKQGDAGDMNKIFDDCLAFLKKDRNLNETSELLAEMKMNNTNNPKELQKILELAKKRRNI